MVCQLKSLKRERKCSRRFHGNYVVLSWRRFHLGYFRVAEVCQDNRRAAKLFHFAKNNITDLTVDRKEERKRAVSWRLLILHENFYRRRLAKTLRSN